MSTEDSVGGNFHLDFWTGKLGTTSSFFGGDLGLGLSQGQDAVDLRHWALRLA